MKEFHQNIVEKLAEEREIQYFDFASSEFRQDLYKQIEHHLENELNAIEQMLNSIDGYDSSTEAIAEMKRKCYESYVGAIKSRLSAHADTVINDMFKVPINVMLQGDICEDEIYTDEQIKVLEQEIEYLELETAQNDRFLYELNVRNQKLIEARKQLEDIHVKNIQTLFSEEKQIYENNIRAYEELSETFLKNIPSNTNFNDI